MIVYLGIDGGGTQTRCLAADQEGNILGQGLAGPSNCLAVGTGAAAAAVMAAAERALAEAGRSMSDVAAVCVGLAGAGRPKEQAEVRAALSFPPAARVQVVPDARIALAGALGGRPGVIVIAGTGSIAFGLNSKGETLRAGGWGWLLGDQGSGLDLGRSALKAALAALDGTGRETVLRKRVCSALGIASPDQAVPKIYADVAAARGLMASLAPLVTEAAEEGDAVALEILSEAGRSLAHLAAAVLRRLDVSGAPVAGVGGVFTNCRHLQEAFAAAVAQEAPGSRVIRPLGSPAEGAVLLARQL